MPPLSKTADLPLLLEDGTVSATALPADQTTSEITYETATFGMG